MSVFKTISTTPKAVRVLFPNGKECWLPNYVAEWLATLERDRDRFVAAAIEGVTNLTCADDASEHGHGGMWCFTRAALTEPPSNRPQCDCANCKVWRALRGAA